MRSLPTPGIRHLHQRTEESPNASTFHCWLPALMLAAGCQPALAQQPQAVPRTAALPASVTVHGVVLDDSLNVPIPDLWLYLNHTKYGAITNAQGEFTVTFPTGWKPVRSGQLLV